MALSRSSFLALVISVSSVFVHAGEETLSFSSVNLSSVDSPEETSDDSAEKVSSGSVKDDSVSVLSSSSEDTQDLSPDSTPTATVGTQPEVSTSNGSTFPCGKTLFETFRKRLIKFSRKECRRNLVRAAFCTAGSLIARMGGGIVASTDVIHNKLLRSKNSDVQLFSEIFLDGSLPEVGAALGGFLFDSMYDAEVLEEGLDQNNGDNIDSESTDVGTTERLLCNLGANVLNTVAAFSGYDRDSENDGRIRPLSLNFGPGGDRYRHKSVPCRSNLDITTTRGLFGLRVILLSIKEGQYKDFVKSPAALKVLDRLKDVVSNVDLDKMTFCDFTTIKGQNKLVVGMMCKLLGDCIEGRFYAPKGNSAKYNKLVTSVAKSLAGPMFAVIVNKIHGQQK